MKLSKPQKLLLAIVMVFVVIRFTACTRYVHWEEEVLLNTGETITVNKDVRYSIKGQPGNPADLGYVPDWVETISFQYGGQSYKYKGDAGIFVLAISPQKIPVLLAFTGGGWGTRNNYPLCIKPNYVQFFPDSSGQVWTWPEKIETWTYNLPANLLLQRDHPSRRRPRYTMTDKATQSYMRDPQLISSQKINPTFTNQDCHEEK
jgi:hypothetical protein